MNNNQIKFSNLENLPNLKSLTGISRDTTIIDLNDPLGTSHYTYTEHCNLSKDLRDTIEYELGLQRLLTQGMNHYSSNRYKKIFKKYNIDYYEMLPAIKQSQKSKDYVVSVIKGMFNLAKSLNIIEHDDFEKYLDDAKITERYNAYL